MLKDCRERDIYSLLYDFPEDSGYGSGGFKVVPGIDTGDDGLMGGAS